MNYFSLRMIQDIHMSWTKKINTLLLQIFGHEATFNKNALSKLNVHCDVFNITFPRVSNANPWPLLAKRKLYNPFKWLEFGLAFLIEIPGWAIKRSYSFLLKHIQLGFNQKRINKAKFLITHYSPNESETILRQAGSLLAELLYVSDKDYSQLINELKPCFEDPEKPLKETAIQILDTFAQRYKKTASIPLVLKFLAIGFIVLSNIIVSFTLDLPLAIIRRILAPSRYIIRPFLQYKHTDPLKWKALCATTFLFTLFVALSIASGGIGLAATPLMLGIAHIFSAITIYSGASSTASIVCLGILFVSTAHIAALAFLEKVFLSLADVTYAAKRIMKEFIFPELPEKLKNWINSFNHQKAEQPNPCESDTESSESEITFNEKETTSFIAQFLHGINPEITKLEPVPDQSDFYCFSLFTGTESLFYPKSVRNIIHPYGQFVFEEAAKSPVLVR